MFPLLLVCFLYGQTEKELVINERYRVEYVMLDVMAVNRRGDVVTDLTREDFTVFEGRKKVNVTHFETLDLRMGQPPSQDVDVLEAQGAKINAPQIIVAFDFESINAAKMTNAIDQVREFLLMLPKNVPVKLCLYSLDSGGITEGFVDFPRQAIEALERYVDRTIQGRSGKVSPWSKHSDSLTGSSLTPGDNELAGLEKGLERCLQYRWPEEKVGCIQATLDDFSGNFENRCYRVIGELESLMYQFQETKGLKLIFLVSPGFSFGVPITAQEVAEHYLGVAMQGAGGHHVIAGGRDRRIKREYRRVVHACIKNRIIFYTFDIFNEDAGAKRMMSTARRVGGSLALTHIYDRYQKDVVEGLQSLASDSGGTFFQVNNMPSSMMDTFDNKTFFYVLGYQSPSGKSGEFRKIKIKCSRKKVKVFHRKGYVGAS